MKKIVLLTVLAIFATSCTSYKIKKNLMTWEPDDPEINKDCESTKEYITAIGFFHSHSDFIVPESEARKLAYEISKGCSGAADRFIRVAKMLTKARMTGKDAFNSSTKFIGKGEREVGAFIEIFQRAFLAEYLDMDVRSALEIAHSLSNQFDGNSITAVRDFRKTTDFCLKNTVMNLDKEACGKLAAAVAKLGENSKQSVASAFQNAYEFLTSEGGPTMAVPDAITLCDKVDGVVLVYKVGHTPKDVLSRAKANLINAGANVLGIILNDIKTDAQVGYSAYYYRYYAEAPDEKNNLAQRFKLRLDRKPKEDHTTKV